MTGQELKVFNFFSDFSDSDLPLFAGGMEEITYKDGTIIFDDDTTSTEIYFVVQGKIKIFKQAPDRIKIFTYLEKGDLFGEVSFIDRHKRSACASASGEVVLYRFDLDAFERIQTENPMVASKFLVELMKELTRKFRSVNEGLDIKSAEYTLHEVITAEKEVKVSTDGGTDYICKIKHADLNQNSPLVKIDIKGQIILLPFLHIRSISLPNKFGKF